ncbi:dTDP-4-dehydrorhamnose 3,5-epimerase [Flexibacterium corallicola]|uniref:dTDP-4-dehydrorhamnose 3,5-epimerase n=1 Tax=Flexibacterium corallicola TaxID=3037259 RepID=UPI00286ED637|nr:dTDP-4-dehydrorhamnose 3,5-epimerase [Pseudovibrio sp. M1P-2-3]
MNAERFLIDGPIAFTPSKFGDDRGFFSEVYNAERYRVAGLEADFVQDNHSFSTSKGVIRGLHFQTEPHAQGKLVRVTRGAVLDVIVDIRSGSPTYGQHIKVELSAENWKQLWVPVGFAHGFCTLTEEVEFLYKVTGLYSKECDRGLAFDDPDLGIDWPISNVGPILSEKDRQHPRLRQLPEYFTY